MINKSLPYVMCILYAISFTQLESEHFKLAEIFINFLAHISTS